MALKRSEKRFRELIEDVAEISIQGYDEERRVTFWNQASEKLYGYTEQEALGQRLEDLIIPAEMRAEVVRLQRRWVERGEKIPSGELTLRNKLGGPVPVFSSHVMLETQHGKEMFCLDVDLTSIIQAEKEKERLREQLRQSQKMEAIGERSGRITIVLEAASGARRMGNEPVSESKEWLLMTITDTGCGIEPHIVEKIFDPYFTTKANGKGTGLGLATVYRIVKNHGGEIEVAPTPEGGSTFRVFLPVMTEPHPEPPTEAHQPVPTGSEHILLVDDEPQILAVEAQILKRLGYRVTARQTSPEALETFTASPESFDLIITDMAMPRMTGYQLAEKVLALRDHVPIIICTGYSDRDKLERAQALGVDTILTKPVNKNKFAQSVRMVLDAAKGKAQP